MFNTNKASGLGKCSSPKNHGAKPLRNGTLGSTRVGAASQNSTSGLPLLAARASMANGGGSTSKNNSTKQKFYPSTPTYPMTSRYLRQTVTEPPTTLKALNSCNKWIRNNKHLIDPVSIFVCSKCGLDDMTLCECILPAKQEINKVLHNVKNHWYSHETKLKNRAWWNGLPFSYDDNIDIAEVNQPCQYFDNSNVPDKFIDTNMYNYIKVHMSSRYSSFEDREEHVRKLALKYLETTKVDLTNLSTTQNNIILITRQKVRDQYEIEVLSKENRPQSTPWFVNLFYFVRACLLTIYYGFHFAIVLTMVLILIAGLLVSLGSLYSNHTEQFAVNSEFNWNR
jgi:hypothetical protein